MINEWNPEGLATHMMNRLNQDKVDAIAALMAHEDGRTHLLYIGNQRVDGNPMSSDAAEILKHRCDKEKADGFEPLATYTARIGKDVIWNRHSATLLLEEHETDYSIICEGMFLSGSLPKEAFKALRSAASHRLKGMKKDVETLMQRKESMAELLKNMQGATVMYNANKPEPPEEEEEEE